MKTRLTIFLFAGQWSILSIVPKGGRWVSFSFSSRAFIYQQPPDPEEGEGEKDERRKRESKTNASV